MMADNETCVACGEPIVVGGERITSIKPGLIHESCFWLAMREIFAEENGFLTGADIRAKIRRKARERQMVKTVVD